MSLPSFEIEFEKDGDLHEPQKLKEAIDAIAAGGFTDLLVFSHGWNNDIQDARQLYNTYFSQVDALLAANSVPGLNGRKFAALKLFWPSKKFTDEELIPGGGAASVSGAAIDANTTALLDRLREDPVRLGQHDVDPIADAAVTQMKSLLPRLDADKNARNQFVLHLRSILNPADAHPDDGSIELFTADPDQLLTSLSAPVMLPPKITGGGGAAALGATGSAAGFFGDLVSGMKNGIRRILNLTTYYKMKERAGTVGRLGLAPALRQIRQRVPNLRIHLIGHSFGGRLVTAAAHALDDQTSVNTISLLQAAFSHNGLAPKFDGKNDGAFRTLITRQRVTGPICITYTHNDKAVGIAYPLASRISRDQASALGDADDPYGGMGRNGAQRTPEALNRNHHLTAAPGGNFPLAAGKVHNFESTPAISNHSDICKSPVVFVTLAAAATT